jgi:hypothetical protein
VTVIGLCPFPVETSMFEKLVRGGFIGNNEAPFPFIDVGSMMYACGSNPFSGYNQNNGGINDLNVYDPLDSSMLALMTFCRTRNINLKGV